MAAIDLLLKSLQTSERTHQVVLTRLLERTRLLYRLGISGKPTGVAMETDGRLYDLTVFLSTGQTIYGELKVNSSLTEDQIERQLKGLDLSKSPPDILVYFLLGTTRFSWNQSKLLEVVNRLVPGLQAASILVIDTSRMQTCLHEALSEHLENDDRDLAVAYLTALQEIGLLTESYATKDLAEWGYYEWFGLYDAINNRPNQMGTLFTGGMGYVPNQSGGFVGFSWYWCDFPKVSGAQAYLQIEETKLCFKVLVEEAQSRAQIRNTLSEAVLEACNDLRHGGQVSIDVRKPQRFGNGYTMTVAEVAGDVRGNLNGSDPAILDWDHCIIMLTQAQTVLDEALRRC